MLYLVIPTYNRVKKLKRCIDSIYKNTFTDWRLVVVADNNDAQSTIYALSLKDSRIDVLVQPEHRFVIGAWNRFWEEYKDQKFEGMLTLCDDVELYPNTIEKAYMCFRKNFPDTDGIVGLRQVCEGHPEYSFKWFGQTIIGKSFAFRYPNCQVHCPDYKHFYQDEEMWMYAKKLNKFVECPEAVLNHYHPSFVKDETDETHNIIRSGKISPKMKDIVTNTIRKQKGLVWGETFELVNK